MKPLLFFCICVTSPWLTGVVASEFPAPFDTEKDTNGPMSAAQTVATAKLPPGFRMEVFASEPDVRQPIAMTTDSRGRLWVAENYTYAENPVKFAPELRDRIVIFEDTNNDGRHDKRTVFWEGGQTLTTIEIGRGGVWALCLPNLLFIPDRNDDDVPDGEPQVVLDGFEDFKGGRHTVANGLRWGPDGWLYGRQGILTHSLVGAPGTPKEQRTPVNVGIWRFHPTRKIFENVALGTTNPWGMDWDEHGEAFFINTVIGHLWHIIPGAHYRRMSGADLDPRIYDVIEQHADHVHWATGEVWTDVRKGVTDATLSTGGGHAHTGLLIYQGGQWPAEWKGKLLTVNYHGHRLNVERLERSGSGYVGRREPDAFIMSDQWFRGIDLIPAPDGGVFVSDWSDAGECHDNDGIHRSSGRIYKFTYGKPNPLPHADVAKLDGPALVKLQLSPNDWLARMSRHVLADRAADNADQTKAIRELKQLVTDGETTVHRLRAMWTLHTMGASDTALLENALSAKDEHIRAWAIRLLTDDRPLFADVMTPISPSAALPASLLNKLETLSQNDPSGLVRLTLASTCQRLPLPQRSGILAGLLAHGEDADDHNLPLMFWCALLPVAETSDDSFEKLVSAAQIPLVQRYGARRLAEEIDSAPQRLNSFAATVAMSGSIASRAAVLEGITDGLSGRRKAPKPTDWDSIKTALAINGTTRMQERVRDLSAVFGDGLALEAIRAAALDNNNTLAQRRAALQALIDARGPGLREACETLLPVRDLSATAASGLALFPDPALADLILKEWPSLDGQERNPVMNSLISRREWVPKVIAAVADGRIESTRFGAYQIRQVRNYNDPAINKQLDAFLGEDTKPTSRDAAQAIARWKRKLNAQTLANADKAKGREVFTLVCGACHKLNGEGAGIGPDLTGAARENIDYLLENIVIPNATVADEYRLVTLSLKDGRSLSGFVRGKTPRTLQLQTLSESFSLETADVAKEEKSALSLMPEGLLEALTEQQVRDLFAYLMTK